MTTCQILPLSATAWTTEGRVFPVLLLPPLASLLPSVQLLRGLSVCVCECVQVLRGLSVCVSECVQVLQGISVCVSECGQVLGGLSVCV